MKIDIRTYIQSKPFKYTLWSLGTLLVLLTTFKAGEFVGFRKASFSYQWGEGYYRSVMGRGRGMFGRNFNEKDFLMGHGIAGPILRISSSTLTIQDRDGVEKIILISENTTIKRFRDTVSSTALSAGEFITAIGSPNNSGQIDAKLIRVLPSPQSATGTPVIPQ